MVVRMPRSGAWAALLTLGLVYACGGDDRDFGAPAGSDTGGSAGASGKGGAASGGTAGKTNTGGTAGKSTTGGAITDAGAGGQTPPEGGAAGGGTVSTGGVTAGGTGAAGGQGGEGGGGGEGGDGIVIPPDPGQPGTAVVAGGHFMKSAHFSLMCSTGEGPGGNTLLSSPRYRLVGGLVGTSQP